MGYLKFFLIFGMILTGINLAPSCLRASGQSAKFDAFKTLPGFEIDLVYEVPLEKQGSWVSMCVDSKGRLITGDQYGKLYRVTLSENAPVVEELNVNLGMAQGLVCVGEALFVNVNSQELYRRGRSEFIPGLYRLTDTDGDDQYDNKELLLGMDDTGKEHGPHGVVLGPDGKLYVAVGNQTPIPGSIRRSVAPRHWDEDLLLGRLPDGRGFMTETLAPGGWIARISQDGKDAEIVATGFRNQYDLCFTPEGELLTFDADMEYDIGLPWYRPTRVNHVISGAEFGWRNGSGKWPAYFADSFGAVANVGPGSPTGVVMGTDAKFPPKYQRALFIGDWSYGAVHAVHLRHEGASYVGDVEPFLTGAPLPVTDLVIHPDGDMYMTVGGRQTHSGLYRVRYTGSDSTEAEEVVLPDAVEEALQLRHQLESFHGEQASQSVDAVEVIGLATKHLASTDRAIAHAARIALEFQPVDRWANQVIDSNDSRSVINGAIALARCRSVDHYQAMLDKLTSISWDELESFDRLALLRAYQLLFIRLGAPNELQRRQVLAHVDAKFPTRDPQVNRELASVLVFLKADDIVSRVLVAQEKATAQAEEIHYAFCLREVEDGWSEDSRRKYFQWFFRKATMQGGWSMGGYLQSMRNAAIARLSDADKEMLGELVGPLPSNQDVAADATPRSLVKQWTVDELQSLIANSQVQPDFQAGRTLTAAAQCLQCHQVAGHGGAQGPDLSRVSSRFSDRDLLTSIIDPNKEVSDQYRATQFIMDDRVVVGRVANLNKGELQIVTNMLRPSDFIKIRAEDIIERRPSTASMMPTGLFDTFTSDEIFQIITYLKSGGDPNHSFYRAQ